MRKKLLILLTVVFLVALSCFITLKNMNISNEGTYNRQISEDIKSEIKNNDVIDLKKIVPFQWDTLYNFPPYATKKDMNDSLGYTWLKARDLDEAYILLVFTNKGKVIQYTDFDRQDGDFAYIKTKILSDQAKFKVIKNKDGILLEATGT